MIIVSNICKVIINLNYIYQYNINAIKIWLCNGIGKQTNPLKYKQPT